MGQGLDGWNGLGRISGIASDCSCAGLNCTCPSHPQNPCSIAAEIRWFWRSSFDVHARLIGQPQPRNILTPWNRHFTWRRRKDRQFGCKHSSSSRKRPCDRHFPHYGKPAIFWPLLANCQRRGTLPRGLLDRVTGIRL